MNALLDGKNEDGEAIAPQLVEQLKSQTENAKKTARAAGYGDTYWFAQDDPALGYLVQAGWTKESLPTQEKPAEFKATRTLGLAQGNKSQVGDVNLDFSALGAINHEQASTLMAAVQDFAEYAPKSKEPKPDEKENFLNDIVTKLAGFTDKQKALIKPIISSFVDASSAKINELHSNLNQ